MKSVYYLMIVWAVAMFFSIAYAEECTFKYLDVVKVTDKNSFFFGCTGEVVQRLYTTPQTVVDRLCDRPETSRFDDNQLTLVKQGPRK